MCLCHLFLAPGQLGCSLFQFSLAGQLIQHSGSIQGASGRVVSHRSLERMSSLVQGVCILGGDGLTRLLEVDDARRA